MHKTLRVLAIVYAIYLFFALVIATPALNILPHNYIRDTYGWTLDTGWVVLNPFKLSLDVSDAALRDTRDEQVLGFSEGSVNLSLASLWNAGWVMDRVKFSNIQLAVARISADTYNFSDLLPEPTNDAGLEEEPDAMPPITIHELDLQSDIIVLSDRARDEAYDSNWDGLHIRAEDLSTVTTEGKPYSIDLRGDGGGTLHWQGKVSLATGNSKGRLQIENLSLRKLWRLGEPWLDFELADGRLALAGDYTLDWADTFIYKIDKGRVELSTIDILPKAIEALPDTRLVLKALTIEDIAVDSTTQTITIESLVADSLAPEGWMKDAQISLVDMFAPLSASTEQTNSNMTQDDSAQKPDVAATQDATNTATRQVSDHSAKQLSDNAKADTPQRSAAAIAPDLPAEPSRQPPDDENDWSVSLAKATLKQGGLRWRSPFTAPELMVITSANATVNNLHWPPQGDTGVSLQLLVNSEATLTVEGELDLEEGNGSFTYDLEKVRLPWIDPSLPPQFRATVARGELDVEGSATVSGFAPQSAELDGAIRGFGLRMDDDGGRIAGWDLLRITGLHVDVEKRHIVLDKLDIDGNVGRTHIKQDGTLNTSNIWKDVDGEPETISDLPKDAQPWTFSLPEITITDGEIDFWDESLPIQFRTVIGGIEGEVRNIDSQTGESAAVDIKGTVDGYAPVSLKGDLSPFADALEIDLHLTFDSVDMAALSPYTVTYAGYAIDRGLLDLDLQYKMVDNQLDGRNSIRIDKLKLGDKVKSDKAADLPLEMALAIMTDSDGVIDMKIPVSGDVASPNFELGGVISQAIFNTIIKVVTSPFTLLAELADSEEDLQRLGFTPGYADLSDQNTGKLDTLGAALEQRPILSLVINGQINQSADTERLQKNILKAQLVTNGLPVEEVEQKNARWEAAIIKRYEDMRGTPRGKDTSVREQYAAVYGAIPITDEQLLALAEERAMNVKAYLLNTVGLAADRAVVGRPVLDVGQNNFSGVALAVQN